MSFRSDPIPWGDHQEWYGARLADPDSLLLIAEDEEGGLVGMVRFDVRGSRALAGVNLAPERRGERLGSTVIALGTERLLGIRPDVEAVEALIKPENIASTRAFERAGYVPAANTEVEGQVAHRLVRERT